MTSTREAKYLSGADLGKTITITKGEQEITGMLSGITHTGNLICDESLCTAERTCSIGRADIIIEIISPEGPLKFITDPHRPVTITGTDTPPGLNLHKPVTEQEQP